MKEKVFFAHANGFPTEVYKDLFKRLPQLDISYISKLGHGKYTITSSWKDLVPEIIDYFEANYSEPVWAIGHSFGAVVLAFAAEQRPDLFKGLIMMDPPVLSRKIRWAMAISQFLGISHKIMPLAKKAANRSDYFPSKAFLAEKLRNKFLFKNFSDASFNNYIQYGWENSENGVKLSFNKDFETKIFALTYPFYSSIKLSIPSYYLYATVGEIANTRNIDSITHLFPKTKFIEIEGGGHLFPFEETEKCINEIHAIINLHA